VGASAFLRLCLVLYCIVLYEESRIIPTKLILAFLYYNDGWGLGVNMVSPERAKPLGSRKMDTFR
jgi:hypothetical protein